MSELAWVLSAGFAGLLLLGVPFVFALGITSLAGLMVLDIDIIVLAQRFVSGTQSFSLLAIPFFILAGDLMTRGGLSRRLVAVANACVRHVTGGLGSGAGPCTHGYSHCSRGTPAPSRWRPARHAHGRAVSGFCCHAG